MLRLQDGAESLRLTGPDRTLQSQALMIRFLALSDYSAAWKSAVLFCSFTSAPG